MYAYVPHTGGHKHGFRGTAAISRLSSAAVGVATARILSLGSSLGFVRRSAILRGLAFRHH